ncbi:MAG TPA: formate dehydrogenase accessory sulfurtransferase FdhD [Terriglobales bacterium]|nr:formate dehydrogenase accessory sulfurtransferase FdhD [Terriglobales bacterium]
MPSIPRSVDLTLIHEWNHGAVRPVQDALVAEEPLEIRIGDTPLAVTMRTPGHDLELAAGFLFTEGIVQNREDLMNISAQENSARVDLRPGCEPDLQSMQRNFFATSSCGICGKASIEQVRSRNLSRLNGNLQLSADLLCELPDRLRAAQKIFGYTGSLHAAGLFDRAGELLLTREDVGRHNAVDKVIGWALLNGRLPLSDSIMLVSGRGGFEIVQKAIFAGIPILACVSAPSGLAVRLAREMGMTLVGFLRGKRFIVYSAPERLLSSTDLMRRTQ